MNSNFKRKCDSSNKNRKKFKEERNIGQLDKDTYEYFSRIAEVLNNKVDEEEMRILADNTIQQTEGIELNVCKHIVAASVLEKIVPFTSWHQLQRIIECLSKENDDEKGSCESRVEETIIKEAGSRIRIVNSEEREDCLQYIINKSEQILQNFETNIFNRNINFVARTCLTICSAYKENEINQDIALVKIVKKFSKKTMMLNDILDYYHEDVISGYLQILLYSLKAASEKYCKKFTRFLIRNCFIKSLENENEDIILELFQNVPWSRLLEVIIDVATPKILNEIYQKLFSNYIVVLALSPKGHFAVCKLIASCTDRIMFEDIIDKLKMKFNEIIASNKLNILLTLSEACIKIGDKQGEFIKSLITALGCSGPNKEKFILPCIVSLKIKSDINLDDITVNFHGSSIFQNLLKFKKPQKFVEAFLSLNISILKRILTDGKGCHITDAFMGSSSVGAKSKDRLLNILKGHYSDLATDKYGSRSFDVIWDYANMKTRSLILSEMSRNIMKTPYGSIIASKTGLEMYIKDKQAWERAYSVTNKTENLFSDIIKPKK